jgi:uncharacterized protein Yka (UPF0111/DUF47 family)
MGDEIREKIVAVLDQNEQRLEALEKVTKELYRIADVWKKEMQKRIPVGSRSPDVIATVRLIVFHRITQ